MKWKEVMKYEMFVKTGKAAGQSVLKEKLQNVLTSFGSIINHMWYFAQFGTICTNLKKHEKFPRRSVTFIKAADFTLQLY